MSDLKSTRTAILDLAEELGQTRGYNAFSFHDLARGVGIRTASVHHYFPTKADLAREVMARYRESFRSQLDSIGKRCRSPRRKLERFSDLFHETLRRGNRLCLCGMLATEYDTLPELVQREVRAFYNETETWLRVVLEEGEKSGEFRLNAPAAVVANTIMATLEGAMISARAFNDAKRLRLAARCLLASLDQRIPPESR
jgi:TetR/AcrR family transcriptional repressor of nem operon